MPKFEKMLDREILSQSKANDISQSIFKHKTNNQSKLINQSQVNSLLDNEHSNYEMWSDELLINLDMSQLHADFSEFFKVKAFNHCFRQFVLKGQSTENQALINCQARTAAAANIIYQFFEGVNSEAEWNIWI